MGILTSSTSSTRNAMSRQGWLLYVVSICLLAISLPTCHALKASIHLDSYQAGATTKLYLYLLPDNQHFAGDTIRLTLPGFDFSSVVYTGLTVVDVNVTEVTPIPIHRNMTLTFNGVVLPSQVGFASPYRVETLDNVLDPKEATNYVSDWAYLHPSDIPTFSTSATLSNQETGSYADVAFSMNFTSGALPGDTLSKDSELLLAFPADFDVAGIGSIATSTTITGNLQTTILDANTLRIKRALGQDISISSLVTLDMTVTHVRVPAVALTHAGIQLWVLNSTDAVASSTIASGLQTKPAKLQDCDITIKTKQQFAATDVQVRFRSGDTAGPPLDVAGKIIISTPGFWDIAALGTVNDNIVGGGSFTFDSGNEEVTYQRDVTPPPADQTGKAVDITFDGLTAPGSNTAGPFVITVRNSDDQDMAQCTVSKLIPLAEGFFPTQNSNVVFSSKKTSSVTTATFTFSLSFPWPADGKITIVLPPAYTTTTISGATATLPAPAGSTTLTAMSIQGQDITFSRVGGNTVQPAHGDLSIALSGVTIPDTVFAAVDGQFEVVTLNASNAYRDLGQFLAPEDVYGSEITDLQVAFAQATVGVQTTVNVTFTLPFTLQSDKDYIQVTFNSGDFDVDGADNDVTVFHTGFQSELDTYKAITGPSIARLDVVPALNEPSVAAGTKVAIGLPNIILPLGTDPLSAGVNVQILRYDANLLIQLPFPTVEGTSIPDADTPPLQAATLDVQASLNTYVQSATSALTLTVTPDVVGVAGLSTITAVIPAAFTLGSFVCSMTPGGAVVKSVSGNTVNCTRTSPSREDAASWSLILSGITNPSSAIETSEFHLSVHHRKHGLTGSGVAEGVRISQGTLTASSMTSNNTEAGQLASFTFTFTLGTPLPGGALSGFMMEFPSYWDMASVSAAVDINGNIDNGAEDTLSVAVISDQGGHLLLVNKSSASGVTPKPGPPIKIRIDGARGLPYAGSDTFDLFTFVGDEIYDAKYEISTPTFIPAPLDTFSFDEPDPEGGTFVLAFVEFTANSPIPADAVFHLSLPAGYDVNNIIVELREPYKETLSLTILDAKTVQAKRSGFAPVIARGTALKLRYRNLKNPPVGPGQCCVIFEVRRGDASTKISVAPPGINTAAMIKTPPNTLHGPKIGTVKKASLRQKTLELATATIRFAEWRIELEEELYLGGKPLSSLTKATQRNDGSTLPELADLAGGAAELWCDWGTPQQNIYIQIGSWPPPPPGGGGGGGGGTGPPPPGGRTGGSASSGTTKHPPLFTLLMSPPYTEPIIGMLSAFGGVPLSSDVTDPHLLNLIILLSVQEEGKEAVEAYTAEQMSRCKVVVPGHAEGAKYAFDLTEINAGTTPPNRITDKDGVPLNFEVSFPNGYTSESCDYDKFIGHYGRMSKALDVLSTSTVFEQANAARILLAALKVGDPYLDCKDMISAYIGAAQTQTVTLNDARGCFIKDVTSPDWGDNPCCNKTKSFEKCCGPQQVDIEYTSVGSINEERLDFECAHPSAIAGLLGDYNTGLQQIEHPVTGCSATRRRDAPDSLWDTLREFYGKCEADIFGTDGTGISCKTDNDCFTTCKGQSGSKKCTVPWDNAGKFLIKCFQVNMPKLLKRYFLDLWSLPGDASEAEFQAEFDQRLAQDDCIGPTAWAYKGYITFEYDDFGNFIEKEVEPDIASCLSAKSCNWQPGLNQQACEHPLLSKQYCAQCYGDFCFTRDDITDQSTCETGECTFGGGTSCDPTNGYCDAYCGPNFGLCNTQAECESSGSCSDWELTSYNFDTDDFQEAACVVPYQASWDGSTKSCDVLATELGVASYDMYATSLGCVDYSKYTQAMCESAGHTWVYKATNEANCTAHGMGCFNTQTGSFNGKDQTECELCSGEEWRPRYTWTAGTWTGDQLEPFTWKNRTYGPDNEVSTTINRGKLEKEIDRAISSILGGYYNIEARCANKLLNIERVLVHDCAAGATSRPDITADVVNLDLGSATLFSSFGQQYQQGTAQIKLADDSDQSGQKTEVTTKQVSVGQFAGQGDGYVAANDTRRVRLQILRRPSLNRNAYDVVRDGVGNIVGQLVGDGLDLSLSGAAALQVCLESRSDITVDPKYHTVGYAAADDRGAVGQPLSVAVSKVSTSLCGTISTSGTYFPINYDPGLVQTSTTSTGTSGTTGTGDGTGTTGTTSSDPFSKAFRITLLVSLEAWDEKTWLEKVIARLGVASTSIKVEKFEVTALPNATATADSNNARLLQSKLPRLSSSSSSSLSSLSSSSSASTAAAQAPRSVPSTPVRGSTGQRPVYKLEGIFSSKYRKADHFIEPLARIHHPDTPVRTPSSSSSGGSGGRALALLQTTSVNTTHAMSVTVAVIDSPGGVSAADVAAALVLLAANGDPALGILQSDATVVPPDTGSTSSGDGVVYPAAFDLLKPTSAAGTSMHRPSARNTRALLVCSVILGIAFSVILI
eukprot:TRINITY_DN3764_c0_g1_i1.p1 TRINITY_DN3764_c0_g1~~TRINITY_DN3764_c0_g1_i1.p1  ORF type:complete len:2450 (+),score=658.25 TRINITY_DN3764_c0_g1_i1:247-7596(+)